MSLGAKTAGLLLGLFLTWPGLGALAQDQPADAAQQPSSGGAQPQGEEEAPVLPRTPQNDRIPVSGVEDYRLDGLNLGRSFVVSQVRMNEVYDNNANRSSTSSGAQNDSITNLQGSVSLQLLSRKSTLNLDYRPGLIIYNRGTLGTEFIQQLSVMEKLYLRRWTVILGNDFAFLPQSPIGLAGLANLGGTNTGIPGVGGGLTGFNPGFVPGQSVQTVGNRISNAILGQAVYTFGPRSTVNISGTYGQVHFFDSGLLNSRVLGLRLGYDYTISARQTITLAYSYNQVFYSPGIPGFSGNNIMFGYRRTVSGRMSLIVEGGPQFRRLQQLAASTTTRLSYTMRGTFRYLTSRNSFDLTYQHRLTDGSGVLLGAETDLFGVLFDRTVSRNWIMTVSGNFNHNRSLNRTTGVISNRQFNSWNANFTASRRLGESATLDLRYNIGRQTSNISNCIIITGCGNVFLNQQIGLGLTWNSRPFGIN